SLDHRDRQEVGGPESPPPPRSRSRPPEKPGAARHPGGPALSPPPLPRQAVEEPRPEPLAREGVTPKAGGNAHPRPGGPLARPRAAALPDEAGGLFACGGGGPFGSAGTGGGRGPQAGGKGESGSALVANSGSDFAGGSGHLFVQATLFYGMDAAPTDFLPPSAF